ncbi:MAG: 30S ribosomal protein S16 [Spirochaetes bacterium]|nr:30S ribosomal protein S16 [Spirochaetota bacterium]
MVKIRLKRTGKRNQPYFRIVVTDERFPRDGRFIEELGYYNPREESWEKKLTLKGANDEIEKKKTIERLIYWYKLGAEPSPTVYQLLAKNGILLKPELRKKS